MKFTFVFLFATALLVHGIQAQAVFNFLSTLFSDVTGIVALFANNYERPPTGSIKIWIQSGYGDKSAYPLVTVFGKNHNKLGDTSKCSGSDNKLLVGKGEYRDCTVRVNEAPYYLKFFASPHGNLALSNLVTAYNSGGGPGDGAYSIFLTGDNVNHCTKRPPSMDGTDFDFGSGKKYTNQGGAWFVNPFNDYYQNYPTTITINLFEFGNRARTGYGNCDLMKIQYEEECRQGNKHACFSDKFP